MNIFRKNKAVTGETINDAIRKIIADSPYVGSVISSSHETARQAMAQIAMSAFDRGVDQWQLNQMVAVYLDEHKMLRAVHRCVIIQVVIYILERHLHLSDTPLERVTEALFQSPHQAVEEY